LGAKQESAILALLTHRGVEDAAQSVGINARTLYRWLGEEEFQAAYRFAQRESFRQSMGRLHQASSAAVTTLLKIMVDGHATASSRVRAAEAVLDRTMKAMELEDIDTRLSLLESKVDEDREN
jgi:hypothetical protein